MTGNTIKFTVPSDDKENMRRILRAVYEALTEKGYNPINQIVGYILSEDPLYMPCGGNARGLISHVDRDELLRLMIEYYLEHRFEGKKEKIIHERNTKND